MGSGQGSERPLVTLGSYCSGAALPGFYAEPISASVSGLGALPSARASSNQPAFKHVSPSGPAGVRPVPTGRGALDLPIGIGLGYRRARSNRVATHPIFFGTRPKGGGGFFGATGSTETGRVGACNNSPLLWASTRSFGRTSSRLGKGLVGK